MLQSQGIPEKLSAGHGMTAERRALYFVGAGFSRALKKGRNVPPLLFDFIHSMADEMSLIRSGGRFTYAV